MKELFTMLLVICIGIWLAITGETEDAPPNFHRVIDRYERLVLAWAIIALIGWTLAFALVLKG